MVEQPPKKPRASAKQLIDAASRFYYGMLLVKDTQPTLSGKRYRIITLKVKVWPEGSEEHVGYIDWPLWNEQCEKYGDPLTPFHEQEGWVQVYGMHPRSYKDTDGHMVEGIEAKRFGFQFWKDTLDFQSYLTPIQEVLQYHHAQIEALTQALLSDDESPPSPSSSLLDEESYV